MSEKLEIYDLNSELITIEDRKKFYSEIKTEFKETGKISKKVKAIRLILMNSSGRIYLQKRSKMKTENAGKYDKTVGGHVSAGDSFNMTVIRECAEELGFPATVLEPEEFEKAAKVTNLDVIGLFKKIEYLPNFLSKRISNNNSEFIQPYMTSIYFEYYNGPIKFVDGESSGIEVFSLEELKEDIKENPDKFTEDIKFMIQKYEKFLVPIK
ncbi:MAG: NUDIX domain-containing protein [Nanoarchaeota archaeon]|nr:NUDIX domain-containing protein [Nanoarchaeota archaeon]MBU1031013.1 NUDIX domain-containing protein [Nanoarchaeota archaeon]MBU1849639.1 NUDIX domain-containing protein [Nanoarchaeota archaeon]